MNDIPEQNTPQWLTWRKSRVGASDIPIILDVSPYCTPLLLWKRKLGFEPEPPMHPGMVYGHQNESRVREQVQLKLEMRLDPVVLQHKEYEWAIASLDGYNEMLGVIAEIKSCNKDDHAIAQKGEVPEKYFPQVQWQMFVSDARIAYYCSSHKDDLVIVKVEYDEDFTEKAFQIALQFYQRLLTYDPPPPSDRDHIEIDDPEFGKSAIDWQQAKETLEEAKLQEKYYREKLVSFTDDSNCQGFGVKLTRVNQRGNVDWDAVCEEYDIDKTSLDKFRKEQIGFWKITVMKVV